MNENITVIGGLGLNAVALLLGSIFFAKKRKVLVKMKQEMDPDDFVLEKHSDKLKTSTQAMIGLFLIFMMLFVFFIIEVLSL